MRVNIYTKGPIPYTKVVGPAKNVEMSRELMVTLRNRGISVFPSAADPYGTTIVSNKQFTQNVPQNSFNEQVHQFKDALRRRKYANKKNPNENILRPTNNSSGEENGVKFFEGKGDPDEVLDESTEIKNENTTSKITQNDMYKQTMENQKNDLKDDRLQDLENQRMSEILAGKQPSNNTAPVDWDAFDRQYEEEKALEEAKKEQLNEEAIDAEIDKIVEETPYESNIGNDIVQEAKPTNVRVYTDEELSKMTKRELSQILIDRGYKKGKKAAKQYDNKATVIEKIKETQ